MEAVQHTEKRELFVTVHDLFHGPLPLLIALATRQEIDVQNIELQNLVHQYGSLRSTHNDSELEHGSEFISSCSTLHYLKSTSLSDEHAATTEAENSQPHADEDSVFRSAEKLMHALYEYGRLKNWAIGLSRLEAFEKKRFTRPCVAQEAIPRRLPEEKQCTIDDLAHLFRAIVEKRKNAPIHTVAQDTCTIEQASDIILKLLKRQRKGVPFLSLFRDDESGDERPLDQCISLFLGLLELIKQGKVAIEWKVEHTETSGDATILISLVP